MDLIRPTDGQVIARVTLGDEEDTRRAIVAAKRPLAPYGRSTTEEQSKILRRLHEAAMARIDDLTASDRPRKTCSRERYDHAGHRYRSHEKQVSDIKDYATEESLQNTPN